MVEMLAIQATAGTPGGASTRWRRRAAVGAWAAVALWIGWIGWVAVQASWGEDVPWFWAAARAILDGANPYNQAEQLRFFPPMREVDQHAFLYLPWVGLAFVPFALLPADAARLVWVLGSLGLLALTTGWLIAILGRQVRGGRGAVVPSWQRAVLVATSVWLGLACLRAGQFGVLLLVGLALLLVADEDGRDWLIGPAALLLSFKPQVTFPILGAIGIAAVLARRRRALASLALTLAGAATLSTAVLPSWWSDYVGLDFASGRYATTVAGGRLIYGTASADAWLRTAFGVEGPIAIAIWVVAGIAFTLMAGQVWRRAAAGRAVRPLALAAAVCLGLLVTPYARQYDYAVLALPLVAVWMTPAPRWQVALRWAALAGLFLLAAQGGDIALAYWFPLVFFGLTLLAGMEAPSPQPSLTEKGSSPSPQQCVELSGSQKAGPPFGKVQEGQSPSWRGFGGVPQNHQELRDTYLETSNQKLVLGLVLLGGMLRLADLGGPSFWYDEAASALLASLPPAGIVAATAADTLPPLYYLLLHGWMAVGGGEVVLRWPSAAFGTLSLALLYVLGREFVGRQAATVGLALAALSPFAIYYAREVRQYSLLGFLLLLATWLAWRVGHRPSRVLAIALALVAAATLYVHVVAGLTLAVLVGMGLLGRRRLSGWRRILAALAGGLLLFTPWLATLPRQVALVEASFWVDRPSVLAPVASLYTFVFGHTLSGWLLPLGLGWILLLVSLTPAWRRRAPAQADQRLALAFLVALVAVPPLLALSVSLLRPIYLDRTLVGAAWPFYLLLGWGLVRAPRPLGLGLGSVGLFLLAAGLVNFFFVPAFAKPPVRAAASAVGDSLRPGDRVLHTSDGSYLPFRLYGVDGDLVAGDPEYRQGGVRGTFSEVLGVTPVDLPSASTGGRTWLVVLADHSVSWQWQQKALLDDRLGTPIETDVGGIKILRYDGGGREGGVQR